MTCPYCGTFTRCIKCEEYICPYCGSDLEPEKFEQVTTASIKLYENILNRYPEMDGEL